jgi:hypothetical protein
MRSTNSAQDVIHSARRPVYSHLCKRRLRWNCLGFLSWIPNYCARGGDRLQEQLYKHMEGRQW